MSTTEIDRLEVVQRVVERRVTVTAAAAQLSISRRQMTRLIAAFKAAGPPGLVSKRRGKPSNRAFSESFKERTLALVRAEYADFGPLLAAEKLLARHEIQVSSETLRRWMVHDGLWLDKQARMRRPFQPRCRRDCFGNLIQIDGSEHAWCRRSHHSAIRASGVPVLTDIGSLGHRDKAEQHHGSRSG